MKKLLLLLFALCTVGTPTLFSQTTADIVLASAFPDSNPECVGTNIPFVMNVSTTGYSSSDVGEVTIDFGDGNSITVSGLDSLGGFPADFWFQTMYAYSAPGTYDITYIVTMFDGTTDTVVNTNEIEIVSCAPEVDINLATDSSSYYGNHAHCLGYNAYFTVNCTTVNYTPSDASELFIDFGDGNTTLITNLNTLPGYPANFEVYVDHQYTTPGVYDISYIVTMYDGEADTVINYNELEIYACDTISGYIFCDENTDCTYNGTDSYIDNTVVYATATGGTYYLFAGMAITDVNGYYEMLVPAGATYDLTLGGYSLSGSSFVCPSSGVLSTTSPSNNNNFAIDCNGDFDLQPVGISGWFHPGFTESCNFIVKNLEAGVVPDGQVRLVVSNPLITFVSGVTLSGDNTATISGDTLTWDLAGADVQNFITGTGYGIQLVVDFYTDPAAVLGDSICFEIISQPMSGDLNPANNIQTVCFPVSNSFDPNYVEVAPCGQGPAGLIYKNTDLVYTIHFQNTGNLAATNVLVKDYLDPAVHDMSTFEYLASSHTVTGITPSGTDGTIVFNFENINLPDSTSDEPNSHGWVSYGIKQVADLSPGTTLENTAGIYFDFNAPVITNTALNTINSDLGMLESEGQNNSLYVYPVPSTGLITLVSSSVESLPYQILNLNGQLVYEGTISGQTTLDLNFLDNGIYLIRLQNGETARLILNK